MSSLLPHKYQAGFTLLEFVVAIVLVTLVLFAIYVTLGGSRHGKSPRISCLSNENQLGLAMEQYIEEYDEKYPCGTHPAPLQALPTGWAGQLYPYVKSTDIYKCPDDPTKLDSSNPAWVPVSYAYNWNLGNMSVSPSGGSVTVSPASASKLNDPSRTVTLCEAFGTLADVASTHESSSPVVLGGKYAVTSSIDGNGGGLQYATGVLRCDPAWAATVGTDTGDALAATGIHKGSSNFLFADGHVKYCIPQSISAGFSNHFGSKDCTAGQGLVPVGQAGSGYAAGTGCTDPVLIGTFSVN